MGSKFLESLRQNMRLCGYALSTGKTYILWIRRFIRFTGDEHPQNVDLGKITAYLTYLASERHVSVNTQKTVQEQLGHSDVQTTEIYTRVLNRGGRAVISPLNDLGD